MGCQNQYFQDLGSRTTPTAVRKGERCYYATDLHLASNHLHASGLLLDSPHLDVDDFVVSYHLIRVSYVCAHLPTMRLLDRCSRL